MPEPISYRAEVDARRMDRLRQLQKELPLV